METAVPNSNHFASRAVVIAQDGAASFDWAAAERSGSTYVYYLDRSDAACTLTLAFTWGISLDIVTKKASAVAITALHWLLSVTESSVLPPHDGRSISPPANHSICESDWHLQAGRRFLIS
jgi:hypothetical protein